MRQLHRLIATLGLILLFGSPSQAFLQSTGALRGFYSGEQAQFGKDQYRQYCSQCHGADLRGVGNVPALIGPDFLRRWYSVGDLFSITSMAMPANDAHGLTVAEDLNIIAYVLQANGFPSGSESLLNDREAMRAMILHPAASAAPRVGKSASGGAAPDAFYTEEQAERGKAYFTGACSMCHSVDPDNSTEFDPRNARGYRLGGIRKTTSLAYGSIPEKYRSVADLFLKIRTTMPGYDGGGLSAQTYVDIVAYLLRANGLPAGPAELTDDIPAMKTMALMEKGFERSFNGKDFSGFGFVIGPSCAPRPAGCGQTEPGSTFRVENGTIVSSGRPYGYMYTEKKYKNFSLRFEYRYEPHPWMETDGDFYGNSGYLLFITDHLVWPKSIEVQGRNAAVLAAMGLDSELKVSVDDEARKRALRPVGQWNSIEIISRDGQVRSYLNGTLVSTVTEHEFKEPGYIGFQAEGAEIHWRYIRIKED
jgi:mono/diheme cytochrome c family protein